VTDHVAAVLVRHGATEWSRNGRHTSVTDLPLLPEGVAQARALQERLGGITYASVLSSPRRRARETARLAGFPDPVITPGLAEWRYGAYEGLTRDAIRELSPAWQVWTGPTPGGESPEAVSERLDEVIDQIRSTPGTTLVFSHGHALRALAARWLGRPVSDGRYFVLNPATVSKVGYDRGQAVIHSWNH